LTRIVPGTLAPHLWQLFLHPSVLQQKFASRSFSTSTKDHNKINKSPDDDQRLSHLSDDSSRPSMVSVTQKPNTIRTATAVAKVYIPKSAYDILISNSKTKKGDVLSVAQLAGIMGAKLTPQIIPLCHPISLSNIDVTLRISAPEEPTWDEKTFRHDYFISVICETECEGKTGVEMEALTGCAVSCLTVWDMLKSVAGKQMEIGEMKVIRKTGGKSGDWERKRHE
jgi:molybdenum cofactor biosynthesis protein MoaC